ncbi:MAG: 4'-phosphopantetheinyl transferase superfamily protein [Saprospiraceae bacterium]
MIGNDIVDLQLAKKESNWKRPRFLQKIFTEKEQMCIATAPNKELAVWLLWSKKESAYKIVARIKKCRFYAPKKLETMTTNLDSSSLRNDGKVFFEGYTFSTKSKITNTHIHTIAQLENNKSTMLINSFRLAKSDHLSQRKITAQKLLEDYAKRNKLSTAELSIQKDEWKIPYLFYKNQRQDTVVSISHHGYFGAYVLQ